MSQSGAKRDNSQYRVRLPKSVRFPIADASKHEASANTISHRDKIEAVAVRCALRQAVSQKCPSPLRRFSSTVFTSRTSLLSPPAALPTLMIQHGGSCGPFHSNLRIAERRAASRAPASERSSNSREALFHLWIIFGEANQHTDAPHQFGLLRPRRHRPRRRRTAEQRDELATSHSITSSARPLSGSGIVRPSALAVRRLSTSSIFTACWTGRSPGFSPLSTRPT